MHVISFNVPFPADYGGAIDVFYKLKTLQAAGVKVILHAFHYGRPPSPELDALCEKVYYYPRRSAWESLSWQYPVMLKSRRGKQLLDNLLSDDHPILFEGMHTCYYIGHAALQNRTKIIRMHNLEWAYYHALSQVERRWWKSLFLRWESAGLKSQERLLKYADVIVAISTNDYNYLHSRYDQVIMLTAFHGNEEVYSKPGLGEYVLYHGNLSVPENQEAVRFLLQLPLEVPLIIAGGNPPPAMVSAIGERQDVQLVANPSAGAMRQLIADAQVHLMPTFQATGLKLKLLNALYQGRHVVANTAMVAQTGLENACTIADDPVAFAAAIQQKMLQPFTPTERAERAALLAPFDDTEKGKKLLALL